jgi:hypothetical protein
MVAVGHGACTSRRWIGSPRFRLSGAHRGSGAHPREDSRQTSYGSAWMSAGMLGRPVRRRLFHVQNRRNPRRCHATTVAGFTRTSDARQPVHVRENHTQSRRSAAVRRTRGRRDRLRTWSWCLSARTSRCSAARERMSERSDRSTATKAGITDRRLCDRAENLNDPAVRHFW